MVPRSSRLISFLVAFLLLFTSVVYACSGLNVPPMSSMSAAMDNGAMDGDPCSRHKQDICKFVRYQMLSLQASSPAAEINLHVSTILQSAHSDLPLMISFLPAAGPPGSVLSPAFKLSLPGFNQILRI